MLEKMVVAWRAVRVADSVSDIVVFCRCCVVVDVSSLALESDVKYSKVGWFFYCRR